MDRREIYGNGKINARVKEEKLLENIDISSKNRELIRNFISYLASTGSGELRTTKLSSQLRRIVLIINKDLDNTNKLDLQNCINKITLKKELSDATKSDYRRCLKQFYKWFKDEDKRIYSNLEEERNSSIKFYKYIEREVSSSYKRKQIDPNSIITEDSLQTTADDVENIF